MGRSRSVVVQGHGTFSAGPARLPVRWVIVHRSHVNGLTDCIDRRASFYRVRQRHNTKDTGAVCADGAQKTCYRRRLATEGCSDAGKIDVCVCVCGPTISNLERHGRRTSVVGFICYKTRECNQEMGHAWSRPLNHTIQHAIGYRQRRL